MREKRSLRKTYEETASIIVGARIKDLRRKAGLTQSQLAAILEADQAFISKIESGYGKQGPTVETISAIAHACGAKLEISFSPSLPGTTSQIPTAKPN